jgi:hypothetical protein
MTEEQIAAQQLKNVPQPAVTTLAPVAAPSTEEPSSTVTPEVVDDMTLYKLSKYFGLGYNPGDKEATDQLTFIYNTIASSMGTRDYGLVTARIGEMRRLFGVSYNAPGDNLFHLWKWLKLDNQRMSIEAEMGTLHG